MDMLKIITLMVASFMFSNAMASSEMMQNIDFEKEAMMVAMVSAIAQDDKGLLEQKVFENRQQITRQDIIRLIGFAADKKQMYRRELEIKRGAFAEYFLERDTQIIEIIRFLKSLDKKG